MVFSFASNLEFSAERKSTTCPWSAGVVDAAGLSNAVEALDATGFLAIAIGGAPLS